MITLALGNGMLIWMVGITVSIIGFEVSRMYLLTDKVREIKERLGRLEDKMDRVIEFEQAHRRDHEDIKKELLENRHDHDRLRDEIVRK